jgi:hypothetical protein
MLEEIRRTKFSCKRKAENNKPEPRILMNSITSVKEMLLTGHKCDRKYFKIGLNVKTASFIFLLPRRAAIK